jgi:metal-dependent amidase/aminoacylase/carboxypeptidase family protein
VSRYLKKDKEMDCCMMTHPDAHPSGSGSIAPSLAIQSVIVEYFGRPAQASAQPYDGINALDACYVAYGSLSAMRQQFLPTDRVHGIITHGGDAANIIPEYCSMKYFMRAKTAKELEGLKKKVLPCFE